MPDRVCEPIREEPRRPDLSPYQQGVGGGPAEVNVRQRGQFITAQQRCSIWQIALLSHEFQRKKPKKTSVNS